jgi:ADP-ribose pyrophosphatase
MSSRFEKVGSEVVYEGRLVSVRRARFRHEDGEVVEREIVVHEGAVGVVAHDGERIYLVRQPREAVGVPDLLELPAGKLDVEGEDPLDTGKRELAEEIGKAAEHWEHLVTFYTSPGFTNEQVHLFLATGLSDSPAETEENERIDVCAHPLADLDRLIQESCDSKTLIGLLKLRERLR